MERKKIDFGNIAAEVGRNTADILDKAKRTVVKTTDQNDDGQLDMEDVSIIAETIGNAAKNTALNVADTVQEKSREWQKKILKPIFPEDLDNADFLLSKLIRVVKADKKHADSDVCTGSIGFITDQRDMKVVNIYRNCVDIFAISFYPDAESEVYYVDPSDRDRYIALDDYFSYLKVARVNELQKIAQDLGAKHFRVTYKEQKTMFSKNIAKVKATAKVPMGAGDVDSERDLSATAVSSVEVAAEMECPGHTPQEPTLHYLQREPSIQTLIALRMDKDSPISHQKYTLKLSNSSGIKEKDAMKIDAVLKAMKISGNTTVTSEVQKEARRFFEYEIDF